MSSYGPYLFKQPVPATGTDADGVPPDGPQARTTEKRGALTGGAATDAALASSRRVLSPARGNVDATVGLQQYFSPPEAAELIAAVTGDVPVLDLTAGNGALLEPYSRENRYGIELDADHIGAEQTPRAYTAINGDVQQLAPMLRAAGVHFPAVAINPPFGLGWRDAVHSCARDGSPTEMNSTVAAYLWAVDLMKHFGQGAMVCGTERLYSAVAAREASRGIYAIVDVEEPMFDGVSLPASIAFFVAPHNRRGGKALRTTATLDDLTDTAAEIREARERLAGHVSTFGIDPVQTKAGFRAVGREHQRRNAAAEDKRASRSHDLTLVHSKVSAGLCAYSKLALANQKGPGAVREVELLAGQHTSYFGQNPRALRQLKALEEDGLISIEPALEEAARSALQQAEKVSTPLFPVKPQMRLGWLTDLDRISCKKSDPDKGFAAGEHYELHTKSKVTTATEERIVEDASGTPELRQFKTERRLLEVAIGEDTGQGSPGRHVFDEGPENITYIIEHFEIPDPGCVAEKFPEEVTGYRRLLEEMQLEIRANFDAYMREQGKAVFEPFSFKEFQLDHMSRLLTKRRGLLAHEQGLGKSLMQMALTEAIIRLGAENKALFVVPQDLIPQWQREAKKFFGREMEEIRTPAKAREVARRLKNGGEGWFITYYEALARVGREHKVLPEAPIDHRAALAQRLARYKRGKRIEEGVAPDVGVPLEATTTRVACPNCRADTSIDPYARAAGEDSNPDWNGEVCRSCGYVHRSRYKKSGYSHLTTAFENGVKVVDEIAEARGDDSQRSKAIRAIARGPHFIGGTGTPLSNFLADSFWPLYCCLGNASAAFPYDYQGGKAKFESDFCVIEHMMGRASDGEANQKKRRKILPQVANVSQFWRLAQPSISRCRKEQTGEDLVERTYYPIRVPMGAAQRRMNDYWVQKRNFAAYFEHKFPTHTMVEYGLVEKWAAALGQLWRLETTATLPCADGPTKDYLPASAKIGEVSNYTPAMLKVLETAIEHASRGEKVLIGSDLILSGKWIAERLQEKGIRAVHITEEAANGSVGTKSPSKRSREIKDFVEGDAQVLCAGVAAVKLGHNLDVASTVIVHGLPYSFSVFDQFIARVHRLTSEREVSVYCIIPKGSLAEQKYELLMNKGGASDLAFDGELQVQPEEATDWAKVIEQMRQRGIPPVGSEDSSDPRGEVVDEAEIRAAWQSKPPVAPPAETSGSPQRSSPPTSARKPQYHFASSHTVENPHSHEQPALF